MHLEALRGVRRRRQGMVGLRRRIPPPVRHPRLLRQRGLRRRRLQARRRRQGPRPALHAGLRRPREGRPQLLPRPRDGRPGPPRRRRASHRLRQHRRPPRGPDGGHGLRRHLRRLPRRHRAQDLPAVQQVPQRDRLRQGRRQVLRWIRRRRRIGLGPYLLRHPLRHLLRLRRRRLPPLEEDPGRHARAGPRHPCRVHAPRGQRRWGHEWFAYGLCQRRWLHWPYWLKEE
mmetsp:Transcript_7713/g.12812  ORF Transcript_7713/g.12812 Transcript_7713/m.12812 type:complete len:229 (+) Transcript_7713:912-1598(+)